MADLDFVYPVVPERNALGKPELLALEQLATAIPTSPSNAVVDNRHDGMVTWGCLINPNPNPLLSWW